MISSAWHSVRFVFMFCLDTVMIVKLRLPAMPVMKRSPPPRSSVPPTIIVPGSSGRLVLRMFRAMPRSLTGWIDSSCMTEAPM